MTAARTHALHGETDRAAATDATPGATARAARSPEGTAAEACALCRGVSALRPHELGRRGEAICAANLESRGWTVLQANWRCVFGEADIVARDEHGELVLVEVKTRLCREGRDVPVPEVAVDARKRARYRNLALAYLTEHPSERALRFDVVAINVSESGARLHHLFDAFRWED